MRRGVKLFIIIGDPVRHTLSPVFQNVAFKTLGIRAFYFAWRVRPKTLARSVRLLRSIGISGFNVTLPLKGAVMKHLDWVHPLARRIGAVNTVCVRGRRLLGFNTDAEGFTRSLREDLEMTPAGKRVVLLGAGGAAQAVGFALVKGRVRSLIVANRHPQRARALVRRLKRVRRGVELEALSLRRPALKARVRESDLVVNATRLGLHAADPLPVRVDWLSRGTRVLDLVYGTRPTRLVRAAKRRGLRAADGLGMLVGQGAASFTLWTGRRAPVRAMRRTLERVR